MRVLHVITKGELGGAQRYLAELARRQRSFGFDVELAAGTRGWLTCQGAFSAVHDVPQMVRELDPRRDAAALGSLRRLLRRERFDVVHTHSSKAGTLGRVASVLERVPFVAHTSHGTPLAERISATRRVIYWAAEQLGALATDRLFAVSEVERDLLRRSLLVRRGALRVMTIVPDDVRGISATWHLSEANRWDLVAIGNLYRNKGYDVLLEALPVLVARHPKVRLRVFGDGPERSSLQAQIQRLGLAAHATLPGVTHDVQAELLRAGIFVMPSRKEGLPLALVEAMAAGVPIVATQVGAVGATLGPGVERARPEDPADVARILERLLATDQLRIATGVAGRAALDRLTARDDPSAVRSMYA